MQFEHTAMGAVVQQYAAVPDELKHRRQWVVWVPLPPDEKGKFGKKPMAADGSGRVATPHDWNTWVSFDEAIAYLAKYPGMYGGLCFMLHREDPYLIIDFDDLGKVHPQALGARNAYQSFVANLPTYVEKSPSGTGWHVWVKAHLDGAASEALQAFAVDFLCHSVFVTVTGQSHSVYGAGVEQGQHLIQYVDDFIREKRLQVDVPTGDDPSKPLNLSDEELYHLACGFNLSFGDRYHGRVGYEPGEWSHTFYNVVGILDKLTGSPAQIQRLIMWSGLVRNSPPDKVGISRDRKAHRIFQSVLLKVRAGNAVGIRRNDNPNVYGWAHGKQQWENIVAERQRLLSLRLKQTEEAEALAKASRERDRESAKNNAANLFSLSDLDDVVARFAAMGITMDDMNLHVPPGMLGNIVLATMASSRKPMLKFAIPAALAAVAGIAARSYNIPADDTPLTLNCVLIAESGTGKTQTMDVWENYLEQAYNTLGILVKPVARILKNESASVQGIYPEMMDSPSSAWFIEEASTQLSMMSKPRGHTDEAFRNFYNTLYDAGSHTKVTSAPKSSTSRQAGYQPVRKLCVSTFWTTTPKKFDLTDGDILDGFASRVIVVRHRGKGSDRQRYRQIAAPVDVLDTISNLLRKAWMTDENYKRDATTALQNTTPIDVANITEWHWAMTGVCDILDGDAVEDALPKAYQMFSRVPANALRIAALLAVVDNPWYPVVTQTHLRWAYCYLIQNVLALLLAMQRGEVGDARDDEVATVKRVMEGLLAKGHARDRRTKAPLPGLPKSLVAQYLSRNLPFSTRPGGGYRAANDSLDRMVRNGQIREDTTRREGSKVDAMFLTFPDG